jgi:hypothetical protein
LLNANALKISTVREKASTKRRFSFSCKNNSKVATAELNPDLKIYLKYLILSNQSINQSISPCFSGAKHNGQETRFEIKWNAGTGKRSGSRTDLSEAWCTLFNLSWAVARIFCNRRYAIIEPTKYDLNN